MKVFDVLTILPPDVKPEDWALVLQSQHGKDNRYPASPLERMQWLKRLSQDEVWGEATVITNQPEYWSLCPPEVVVQTEAGKKLTKAQRTQDVATWAVSVHLGSLKKNEIKTALKHVQRNDGQLSWYTALHDQYFNTRSNGADLYETNGVYELADQPRFFGIAEKILREISSGAWWSWDSETDQTLEEDSESPNPWSARLVDISISTEAGHAYRIPVNHEGEENVPLQDLFGFLVAAYQHTEHYGGRVVLHNCKYDYSVLANPIQKLPVWIIYEKWLPLTEDTMLMAQVANEPRAGLKPLAEARLGAKAIDYKKLTGGKPFSTVPTEPANVYAGQDADWTLQLHPQLLQRLQELEVEHVYRQEMELVEFFMRIERRGILVDQEALDQHHADAVYHRERALENLIVTLDKAGVDLTNKDGSLPNPGSSQQMARWFFSPKPQGLGLPVLTTTPTGAPSTGAKAWNKLQAEGYGHPAIAWYRMWSKYEQRVTAFTVPWRQLIHPDGRLHPVISQVGARTGRTTADSPNVQQAYKDLRKMMLPEPGGEMAGIDYSQIELRVLACEFDEPKMLETYNLPRFLEDGSENPAADIHNRTLVEVGLPNRTKAKNFNFGKAFGAGAETLSVTAAMPKPIVEAFLRAFDEAYPDYTRHLRERQRKAEQDGYVRNWNGRIRLLPPYTNDKTRAANDRLVANTPVQSGALDIIKWAVRGGPDIPGGGVLQLLRDYEKHGIYAFNFVHDEIDFECGPFTSREVWHEFLQKAEAAMAACNPWPDKLPLYCDVEVGPNWGDLRALVVEQEEAA